MLGNVLVEERVRGLVLGAVLGDVLQLTGTPILVIVGHVDVVHLFI